MTECHECNSEISEDEAFCPFCGIALTQTPVKIVEEEISTDNEDLPTVSGDDAEADELDTALGDGETDDGALPLISEQPESPEGESGFMDVASLQSEKKIVIEPESVKETEEVQEEVLTTSVLADEKEEKKEKSDSLADPDSKEDKEPIETIEDKGLVETIEDVEPIETIEDKEPVETIEDEEPVETIEDKEPVETIQDEDLVDTIDDDVEVVSVESENSVEVAEDEPEAVDDKQEIVDVDPITKDPAEEKLADVIKPVAETEIEDTGVSSKLNEDDLPIAASPREDDAEELAMAEEFSKEEVESKTPKEAVSANEEIAGDPDFTATIPYISADIGEMKIAETTEPETTEPETTEPETTEPETTEPESSIDEVVEAKEVEETVPADSAEIFSESPTVIETPAVAIASDNADDSSKEGSSPIESDTPTPDLAAEARVSEADVADGGDAKPYTTPNIGVEDTDGSNKTKLKPLGEGTVLNERYQIVRRIGGGGMGAVYLANDKNLGGVLRAVKEMVQSYIEEEQQAKAISDFKRESMLLTTLEHAAIPTIYDYFFDEKESRFYLVMKYISGGDLSGRLRSAPEGKLDERTVVEWGIEIADVLDYLHNHEPPIVYRDLKPANIMLDGNTGRAMLIDFGIARWVNKEEKGVTAVGTMGYAPPELFSGNVEPRSDIYSLGSTMFHLMTGADPQSNPLLIFDFDKNPRPRQINSSLSDGIEQILMKSVEYNADGRFSGSAEFRDVLTEHLRSLIAGRVTYGVSETPAPVSLADQSVFCGFCGQKIVATDMFCAFCGAKQPLAQPGVQSQAYVPPSATAKLFIQGTSDLNAPTFEIEKAENLVGRRDPMSNIFPEVDLSKFDPQTKISRKHARIWRDGENFMLEDLGSSNGTILESGMNGETRLNPKEPRQLSSGDIIRMGDTTLHFVVG